MKPVSALFFGGAILFFAVAFRSHSERLGETWLNTHLPRVAFETVHFEKKSAGCLEDENHCARVAAEYPKAVEGPKQAVAMINDSIMHHVRYGLAVFATNEKEVFEDLGSIADRFIEDYQRFAEEQNEEYRVGWFIEIKGEVLYQSDDLVSISLSNFSYTGGAHPNSYRTLLNFDLKNRRTLQVEDLITDREGFKQLAESYFREYHQIDLSTDLNEAGFFWDQSFFLPANFAFKEEGLYLYYNNYEAAAYAVGATEILIPWNKLNGLIRKMGPN